MKHIILLIALTTATLSMITASERGLDVFFSEDNRGRPSVRLIDYDISKQKLRKIYYMDLWSEQQEYDEEDHEAVNSKLGHYGLSVRKSKKLVFKETFDSEKYMVRTNGRIRPLEFGENPKYRLYDISEFSFNFEKKYRYVYRSKSIKTGETVEDFIMPTSVRSVSQEDFICHIGLDEKTSSLSSLPMEEKASISQVVTELTMLSLGYDQLVSQYYGKGFDGLFKDRSDHPEYFITESKFSSAPVSARAIMAKHLTEERINDVIQRGLCSEKSRRFWKNMEELNEIISNEPDSVFKFVHRLTPSGHSQSAIQVIDQEKYLELSERSLTVDELIGQVRQLKLSKSNLEKLKKALEREIKEGSETSTSMSGSSFSSSS